MYTLAFDTTSSSCSIVILQDKEVVASFSEQMVFGQSEVLIPEIRKLLNSINKEFADMDLILVCVGPGSFTGVRASISAARAFGIACLEKTIMGISAFEGYISLFDAEELSDLNIVVIETKRDDFYYQIFDNKGNKVSEPQAKKFDDIIDELRGNNISVIGDGVERFLSRPTGLHLHCIRQVDCPPIKALALKGLEKYNNKNIDFPKPLYLRAPDVCMK